MSETQYNVLFNLNNYIEKMLYPPENDQTT